VRLSAIHAIHLADPPFEYLSHLPRYSGLTFLPPLSMIGIE